MQILNETGNETAGAGDAADGADAASFVCTLANIQALSAEVQVSTYLNMYVLSVYIYVCLIGDIILLFPHCT